MKNKVIASVILVVAIVILFFGNIHFNINDTINISSKSQKHFLTEQKSINIYEEFDNIENVELNLKHGNLKMLSGNKLSIKGNNVNENCYNYIVNDKKLIIEEKNLTNSIFYGSANYVLTVPSEIPLKTIIVNSSNGSLKFNDVCADEIHLQAERGSLEGFNLDTNILNVNAGMGSVNLHDVLSQNINITSGMGSVNINCKIDGDDGNIKIDSPIGSVNLTLDNNPSNFYYDLANRSSSVNIDGVSATNYKYYNNNINESKYGLIIGSGISSVEICFNKNNKYTE